MKFTIHTDYVQSGLLLYHQNKNPQNHLSFQNYENLNQITIHKWLSEQKPDMFAHKLKFILLPQLILTLNNYACLLSPLANVDWSAVPECFLLTMYIHNWWNGDKGEIQLGRGDLIWLSLSVHVCLGLAMKYWPFLVTCTCHSYSKFYYLCHLASLLKHSVCQHPPHPHTPSYKCWPNINEFHKTLKTGKNQLPYMWKCPREKTFTVFHSTANLFPWIMALLISNISLQNCYSKSFTANSYFPLKTQKFPPWMHSHIWYYILARLVVQKLINN